MSEQSIAVSPTTHCGSFDRKFPVCCKCFPARWVLAVMSFFGTFNVFSTRVNLSVAIVAMIDYEGLADKIEMERANLSEFSTQEPISAQTFAETNNVSCGKITEYDKVEANWTQRGKFLWDENDQGVALGSYFYGYVCAQVIGTWLGRKIGRVRVIGFSMFVASLSTVFMPSMAEISFAAFVTTRVITGLFSGVFYPIMHGMWGAWAPPLERGKLMTLQFAGASAGTFVVLPLAGFLASTLGWESVFYVTGIIAAVWSLAFWFLMYDNPASHPRILDKERNYIESSLRQNANQEQATRQQKMPVPWLSMLTSKEVWSMIIPHFSSNFGTFIFLTMLPTYLKTVLNFDIQSSGAVSSIPYITKLCLFPVAGFTADWILARNVKLIYVRKIWTGIGIFIPGIAIAMSAYAGCNSALIMFLFTLPVALDTFTIPGFKSSMIEIAPAFSGLIFAFANTFATTSGFLAPQIAGVLRESHRDNPIRGWTLLFWLAGGMYIVGGLAFVIFGSSDVQKWAREGKEDFSTQMKGLTKTKHNDSCEDLED